jgi:hypothetical protein
MPGGRGSPLALEFHAVECDFGIHRYPYDSMLLELCCIFLLVLIVLQLCARRGLTRS